MNFRLVVGAHCVGNVNTVVFVIMLNLIYHPRAIPVPNTLRLTRFKGAFGRRTIH